jgi:hypothetical protein
MANPPPLGKMWRCPAHVDDLLAKVPGLLGPAHRFRKIKNASVIKPGIPRGSRNMGHIEIEFDDSDSDDDSEFFERAQFGKHYRLPEKGVMLDFLSRYVDPHLSVIRSNLTQSTKLTTCSRRPEPRAASYTTANLHST